GQVCREYQPTTRMYHADRDLWPVSVDAGAYGGLTARRLSWAIFIALEECWAAVGEWRAILHVRSAVRPCAARPGTPFPCRARPGRARRPARPAGWTCRPARAFEPSRSSVQAARRR